MHVEHKYLRGKGLGPSRNSWRGFVWKNGGWGLRTRGWGSRLNAVNSRHGAARPAPWVRFDGSVFQVALLAVGEKDGPPGRGRRLRRPVVVGRYAVGKERHRLPLEEHIRCVE
jgi:hypothetical protein